MKKYPYFRKPIFFILCAVLILLRPTSIYAQADKPIVTVLDFTVSQVSQQEAAILVDYFSGHLVSSNEFRVIDRTQRQTILSELKFSYDGCTDEDCQLEIGKLLAARFIFIGSIGKLGSRYILNMGMVEVETGETVKSVSDKYDNMDSLVDDTVRIVGIFTETDEPAYTVPEKTTSIPTPAPTPVVKTPESASSTKPAKKKLPIYFDGGVNFGGTLNSDAVKGVCWGLYAGGLFPIVEFFYIGAQLNFLASMDDFNTGALFFGGSAILGNPGKLALGVGVEVSNAFDFTGTVVLGGSLTTYIGGFDIRLFYGKDLGEDITVVMLGCGGHF